MSAPSDDISWWYCCLNVAERTIIRNTAEGLVLTLFQGIPLPVWDAFWLATDHNSDEFKEAFRAIYHLSIGTMESDGEAVAAVVIADGYLGLWVGWSLFVASPSAACPSGCEQSRVP